MAENTSPKDEKKPEVLSSTNFDSSTQLTETDRLDPEYNPFENRSVENSNSVGGAVAHAIKSSLGTGILAMPMAFKNAGLLFGVIGAMVIGIICTHCVYILVQTSHSMCRIIKRPSLGFAETAQKVCQYGPMKLKKFANAAKQTVDIALVGTYFSVSCVYIVFIAESLKNVLDHHLELDWNIRIYIALVTIPLIFTSQIRKLKHLVPFSATANLCIVITFAIIIFYMFKVKIEFSNKPLFVGMQNFPLFFSTVMFAMEGVGAILPIENSMDKPQHFLGCPGVLNMSMLTNVSLYALMGFFGYARFGDSIEGSITLNLEKSESLADVAKILMAVAIFCSYGLIFYVPVDVAWRKLNPMISKENHNMAQITLRAVTSVMTGVIAASVPSLGVFIGLIGAIFSSILGLLLPTTIETVFRWPGNFGKGNWILWKNVVLGMIGMYALIAGTILSITDIIKLYSNSDK